MYLMQVPHEEQRIICNGKPLQVDARKTMKQVPVPTVNLTRIFCYSIKVLYTIPA
jgi:hypothetical protein